MIVVDDEPTPLLHKLLSLADVNNMPMDIRPEEAAVVQKMLADLFGTLSQSREVKTSCCDAIVPLLVRMCQTPEEDVNCLAMMGLSNFAVEKQCQQLLIEENSVDWLASLLYSTYSRIRFDAAVLLATLALGCEVRWRP